eukprot:TRINITY_DN1225_c0_g1_i1.p3 TRINITY_DN1225_c0_g1~~TRINITY_DN1225_c0_g1_i1.p3  ORF type:complete len:150 (-),score=23.57 TRINITY_DN1225_c0_g1_i1:147-596(-)
MILSAEYEQLKAVKDYFSFLNTLVGRGVFNIYLASTCVQDFTADDPTQFIFMIAGAALFVVGVFYVISHYFNLCGPAQVKAQLPTQDIKAQPRIIAGIAHMCSRTLLFWMFCSRFIICIDFVFESLKQDLIIQIHVHASMCMKCVASPY